MTRMLTVAAIQFAPGLSRDPLEQALILLEEAASGGAQLIILPELFLGPYFCKTQEEAHFALARPTNGHPVISLLSDWARNNGVVLTVSFFERDGPHFYNSVAMIDADGAVLGTYRKSHIPDGPGYQEKFYFRPGSAEPNVWETAIGRVGVGICWDQWFPEVARSMALKGADVLVYPTAIGSEPNDPSLDTAARWRRAMVGHAVSNVIPVVAANRVGDEDGQVFYGESFIAGPDGEFLAKLDREETAVVSARFDLEAIEKERAAWGFFRDRRPDLYGPLTESI
ncbi:MAG: nitrilase-related carbon-nitrogen hydrolase [Pseudomonadota bacterium]